MPKQVTSVPKYRRKRSRSGKRWNAITVIDGRELVLGLWRSPDSYDRYQQELHSWLAAKLEPNDPSIFTVGQLADGYNEHCRQYYRKHGKVTREAELIRSAFDLVLDSHRGDSADSFGSMKLKQIRSQMVSRGWTRGFVNKQVDRIKRGFRWAVENELLEAGSSYNSLLALSSLAKGRCSARESEPIRPVDDTIVTATLPHLPDVVADMVRIQRLLGCRPAEIVEMRPANLETTEALWTYYPDDHKTEHLNKDRRIVIGPKAQRLLQPYLSRKSDQFCFSPVESERARRRGCHRQRKTPVSCGNRPGSNRRQSPIRVPGKRYTVASYRRSIHRACEAAEVESWSPNQLRHSAASEIRKRFGLEAAQVVLGHQNANVTQVYAERDKTLAERVMLRIG